MKKSVLFIILIIIFAMLLRFIWFNSLIERDEATFAYVASNIKKEGINNFEKVINSEEVRDNKPPLLYIFYYSSFLLFGESIQAPRLLNNILFFVSIYFLYISLNFFIKNNWKKYLVLLFYIYFMDIPYFEGQLAMSESIGVSFLVIFFYFTTNFLKTREIKNLYLSVIFIILSTLIKLSFFVGYIVYFYLIYIIFLEEKKLDRKYYYFLIYLLSLNLILFLIFLNFNIFAFIKAIFFFYKSPLMLTQYVSLPYWFLFIIEGGLIWISSIIGLFIYLKKKKNQYEGVVLFLFFTYLLISFIPPAFGHYFIHIAPFCSILAGVGFYNGIIYLKSKKTFLKYLLLVFLLVFSLFSFYVQIKQFPDFNYFHKGSLIPYSDQDTYNNQIKLSDFIKNNTNETDNIFVFGWSPETYWLTRKKPYYGSLLFYCPKFGWTNQRFLGTYEYFDYNNFKVIVIFDSYEKICWFSEISMFEELESKYGPIKIGNAYVYVIN